MTDDHMFMAIFLLLIPVLGALGYLAHRKRLRGLEIELAERADERLKSLIASRDEAERKSGELAAMDRARCSVLRAAMSEMRTPLMMLTSPLQSAMQFQDAAELDRNDVQRMMQQAHRLQRSVDHLENVLGLEIGASRLELRSADFVTVIEQLVMSLRPQAERHGITVQFSSNLAELPFAFDRSRLEQAVRCLVERAFADMRSGDMLQFALSSKESNGGSSGRIVLEITDTGRPIFERYLKVIHGRGEWESFEESVGDSVALGLALAHRFIALHGGELEVERLGAHGTRTRMVLPRRFGVASMRADEPDDDAEAAAPPMTALLPREDAAANEPAEKAAPARSEKSDDENRQTTVLVVDDHAGTRGYLAYALRRHHHVLEAANGKEALAIIRESDPDLVISDIMMPVMDGAELCRAVKSDESLNHIPVFLVTANAVPTIRKEGLESGADDYLVKPFDLDEAIMRINNEIKSRSQLRKRFSREVVMKPSDITVTSADEAFLNRAREIVEENIENGNFGVQELAGELGLSPRQLQRRLRDSLDQSPVEFIRLLRLQRAAQLLEGQYGNVSEVAYSVGFTSLSYFAKCFREQFGSTPSEFKAEQAV